jgi:hypothetical protein
VVNSRLDIHTIKAALKTIPWLNEYVYNQSQAPHSQDNNNSEPRCLLQGVYNLQKPKKHCHLNCQVHYSMQTHSVDMVHTHQTPSHSKPPTTPGERHGYFSAKSRRPNVAEEGQGHAQGSKSTYTADRPWGSPQHPQLKRKKKTENTTYVEKNGVARRRSRPQFRFGTRIKFHRGIGEGLRVEGWRLVTRAGHPHLARFNCEGRSTG